MSAAIIATTSTATVLNASSNVHTTACKLAVSTYDTSSATIQQMQEYAGCIQQLYPQDFTTVETILIKSLIVCVFLGVATGVYVSRKNYGDKTDMVMQGLLGGCFTLIAAGVLFLTAAAVKFLFS